MSRLARVISGFLGVLVVSLASAGSAAAQAGIYETPAHISFVEGTAVLERDGEIDRSPRSMPLLAGDRVRTEAGRLEVLFSDGSTLHLDANTVVDFQSDEVVRLLEGRVRVNIPGPTREIAYRVDAPGAWVEIRAPGEYRVSLLGGERAEVELAVLRGVADLVNEQGATELRAGERAYAAANLAPSQPYVFNSAAWDEFDRWSEDRRDRRLGVSAQYLPSEVRPYAATLDYYGTWRHEPAYGYVWYPRVAPGWRPYYYGRWKYHRPFGWTWIGHDPWAWPTHHFGRWGFSAGVWFWIPGSHWGPAWVSWAYAPGYVSWCPLGFDNRPLFSFVSVNIFGGRRFTPWHGWTVIPHRRFGRGVVHVNVVNVTNINVRTRERFVVRDAAPRYTGVAVARASTPIRAAGSRITGVAVPRGSAPGIASPSADMRTRQAVGRRSGSDLTGPGYPAPAREPRPGAVSSPRRDPAAAVPRSGAPDSQATPGTRRAVPRGSQPSTRSPEATPAPERSVPARRAAPRGDSGPPPSTSGSESRTASPDSRRAVPRGGAQSAPAPSPRGGATPGATPSTPPPRTAAPVRRAVPRGGASDASPRESRSSAVASPRSNRIERPQVEAPPRSAPAVQPTRSEAAPRRAPSAGRGSEPPRVIAPRVDRQAGPSPEVRAPSRSRPRSASSAPGPTASRAPSRASAPAARPAPSSGGGGGAVGPSRSRPRSGGPAQSSSQPRRRRGGE